MAIGIEPGSVAMAGLQGLLRYDPQRLRFAGLRPDSGMMVMVGDDVAGELRVLSLSLDGGPLRARTAVLVFDVVAGGYRDGLSYRFDAGATRDLREPRRVSVQPLAADPGLVVPDEARKISLEDWNVMLADRARAGPARVPGQYVLNLRYGDATLNGAIDVLDAAHVANLAVGNRPLLTDASKDYVIAANVYPANLPGLGEDGDAAPPGRNADGSFGIDVLDAAIIANEAVGSDQDVAGELIPGRGPLPIQRVVLSGVLPGDRTLTRDTVYELRGLVIVPGGVTLTIAAGTILEGDEATRGTLAVYRGGNIVARGTRLEPIVMTCNAAVKQRGCWGGLVINGFSLLNNGEILPGGVDVNGCPQKTYPTSPGYGGGCLIQDNSGMLRYVRIEYAGMLAGGASGPGLALLGVGSGTVIDSVQVRESLGDGLFIGGGTVDIRSIVLGNNAGDGLRWEDGWVGRAQFVMIQQGADNDHAIHGINWGTNPDAGPRSHPWISNVTIAGPTAGLGATGNGLFFELGSGGVIENAIVLRAGVAGLEIQDAATCTQALGGMPGLEVRGSIFFGSPAEYSADADCIDEGAYAAARGNRVVDPLVIAPFNTLTPDARPAAASPATTGWMAPPADGFFDAGATFVGAVRPANAAHTSIPWYAGWTRGW